MILLYVNFIIVVQNQDLRHAIWCGDHLASCYLIIFLYVNFIILTPCHWSYLNVTWLLTIWIVEQELSETGKSILFIFFCIKDPNNILILVNFMRPRIWFSYWQVWTVKPLYKLEAFMAHKLSQWHLAKGYTKWLM